MDDDDYDDDDDDDYDDFTEPWTRKCVRFLHFIVVQFN